MRAVTGQLDDQPAVELGVHASQRASTGPIDALHPRSRETRLTNDRQKPAFKRALATSVDHRVDEHVDDSVH